MAEAVEEVPLSPEEMLAAGRRHLAVRDYTSAVETLAKVCENLAKAHGDVADECAEAYLWYGKALLGLSREENGVLGDGVPGGNEEDNEEENAEDDAEDDGESADTEQNGVVEEKEVEVDKKEGEADKKEGEEDKKEGKVEEEKNEPESTTKEDEPGASTAEADVSMAEEKPGPSNGEADESIANLDNEDDVDNLQLAWEMLDLSRSILQKRAEAGADAARALLAEVHLALGEVALESETYDKAVVDMVSCLDIQKELYKSDDRRIAETHYHIGIANSLATNFEDAITHFKNAANILETRIKTLENPSSVTDDATVKKYSNSDPLYTVEGEIKELKELLPEIQEKIQDMMDYKTETIKRVRESLFSNGESTVSSVNGAGSSKAEPKPAASDISHLIKRKRKNSTEESPAPKRVNS
ncbi:nuclear autoantigenic sperm protein [Bicyclus anynana]|uniref:Nuclear autoantigenic sperm protein n=1 Tax=Bicyclus anynana TaxID=110368 RepID=A0ABM3LMB5_BICAN|nr:nuclear autoantigenic sperm protein [Bicyclus anynana]XP_052740185.1 nuclear autoantigenic sperm protein [Bicyclus anynana]